MTRKSKLRTVGFISVALAVIGSLTSISVVRAGGADGAVYLSVNITLAVFGAALLFLAVRDGVIGAAAGVPSGNREEASPSEE